VTMEHGRHRIPRQRLFQPAAAEERIDLERLPLDRRLNRRVVKDGNQPLGAKLRQRRFELQGLVQALVHEILDDAFTPRTERAPPKAAGEALDACEADASYLGGVAVERHQAGV